MPSLSPKQRRFMNAVAHDPKFAAKVGVPMKVGREFSAADQAKTSMPDPLASAIKSVAAKRRGGAGRGGRGGIRF